jgi:hypothetical protein
MSDPHASAPALAGLDDRIQLLAEQAGQLGGRRVDAATGARRLGLAGGVGIGLGLALIMLGWYGSAQTTLPFEQMPYLISGGLLGLALVVAGGLLYTCAWLTRLVRDNQVQHARTAAHQQRVEEALALLATRLGGPHPADTALVVTAAGTMLHRPSCPATSGLTVHPAGADELGLALCGLCRPERPATAAAPRRRRPRKEPAA